MEPKLSKETVLEFSKDHKFEDKGRTKIYEVEFIVDPDFGVAGAVTVVSCYDNELFLESIDIGQSTCFTCKSWVQPNRLHPDKRIFFANKVNLHG